MSVEEAEVVAMPDANPGKWSLDQEWSWEGRAAVPAGRIEGGTGAENKLHI